MPLYQTWTDLCVELDKIEIELRTFAASTSNLPSGRFTLAEECLLEGLLSRLWQGWGNFWRTCIFESCMGTIDGAGNGIAALASAASADHISAAAIKAKQAGKTPPYWGAQNTILRLEPTWGDVDILSRIIPRLGPSNQAQMIAAISSVYTPAKDIQTIRNATAHTNHQTAQEVLGIRTRYISYSINHPIQSLFWTTTPNNDYLILEAIEEFREAALASIS